jgi:catechol 2,3-dioxygenase-like lactoylglutathione lyase family enzyme
MPHAILGLHHVTATVNDAQADLDFCLNLLGMRLVKKTVNFDNHDVYHFYYGTGQGAPGTIWTTFPYKNRGVRVGTRGAGQVVTTAFSVPAGIDRVLANAARRSAGVAVLGCSTGASARRSSAWTIPPACGSSSIGQRQ